MDNSQLYKLRGNTTNTEELPGYVAHKFYTFGQDFFWIV